MWSFSYGKTPVKCNRNGCNLKVPPRSAPDRGRRVSNTHKNLNKSIKSLTQKVEIWILVSTHFEHYSRLFSHYSLQKLSKVSRKGFDTSYAKGFFWGELMCRNIVCVGDPGFYITNTLNKCFGAEESSFPPCVHWSKV